MDEILRIFLQELRHIVVRQILLIWHEKESQLQYETFVSQRKVQRLSAI